jgi:hypothetical protein
MQQSSVFMSADNHFRDRMRALNELADLIETMVKSNSQAKDYGDFWVIGASYQFISNLRGAILLLNHGFDSEPWILMRCLAEISIRVKWAKKNQSNAKWLIIGTELSDLKKLLHFKKRNKIMQEAVSAIDQRLVGLAKSMRKNGRYWDKRRGMFRKLISTEQMARECGMLKKYRSYFRYGSDHTHFSHRVLERFMELSEERDFRNFVTAPLVDLSSASNSVCSIAVTYVLGLRRFGWQFDEKCFLRIASQIAACDPYSNACPS